MTNCGLKKSRSGAATTARQAASRSGVSRISTNTVQFVATHLFETPIAWAPQDEREIVSEQYWN